MTLDEWLRAVRHTLHELRAEYEAAGRRQEFEEQVAALRSEGRQLLDV